MLTDAELAAMRADVIAGMPDVVLITRAGEPTVDPESGDITMSTATTIYSGPAHVRVPDSYELDVEFGGREETKQRYHIYLPEGLNREAQPANQVPRCDDVLVIQPGSDAPIALVGVPMRITAVTGGSWNLSYRVAGEVLER